MDDDGGLSMRHWPYFEQPMRGNLGLQLMSSAAERDPKPLHSNGPFLRRDGSIPEPSVPMNFVRDGWIHHSSDNSKMIHMLSVNHQHQHQHPHPHQHQHHQNQQQQQQHHENQHHQHQQQQHHQANYGVIPDPPAAHTIQMLQQQEQPKNDKALDVEKPNGGNDAPLKKRSQGRPNPQKTPKPKKPRKAAAPKEDASNGSAARGRGSRKSAGVLINGISYDISRIPTPVCTCTGNPQQCYRWGLGGWQSACCTTNHSEYPLPMSTKRRGARIAGRKMSQGAFTKVLEKLVGEEGYNLSNPIDLKPFWAKHGTNKFVTISEKTVD